MSDFQAQIWEEATASVAPAKAFINGSYIDAKDQTLDAISPIDGKTLTWITDSDEELVNKAVASAKQAFEDGRWSRLSPKERKRSLLKFADELDKRRLELGVLQSREMGMPVSMAVQKDAVAMVETIRWYAEAADKIYDEVAPLPENETGMILRIPLGVVGAIIPWNSPMMIASWKLGAALVSGNSIILKPAEDASLALAKLGEIAAIAGIPDGVINIIPGRGSVAGKTLALHNDVDVITFTGSGAVGKQIMRYSADSNMKRVYIEAGGKNPNIIMEDAPDLTEAALTATKYVFANQGQVCMCPSRLLVQASVADEVVAQITAKARTYRIGSPLDTTNHMGPIVNDKQRQNIVKAIEAGAATGADVLVDGRSADLPEDGFYLGTTVVNNVQPKDALAQEEIFGPVLSIISFDTLEQAIDIANDSQYGLGAAFWSKDIDKVMYASKRLVAGTVVINSYGGTPIETPFGGFKQSGNGRDKSLHAIDKFTDLKAVLIRSKW